MTSTQAGKTFASDQSHHFAVQGQIVDSLDLAMTIMRPFINVDEWQDKAMQRDKQAFLNLLTGQHTSSDAKRIAQKVASQGFVIAWKDLLNAYAKLLREFVDWFYNQNNTAPGPLAA